MSAWISLLLLLILQNCFGQSGIDRKTLFCSDAAEEILNDSTLDVWTYPGFQPHDYNCLGRYFAARDIENGKLLIHSYGDLFNQNHCTYCNFTAKGINFFYHFDILSEETTEYIEGYNDVSKNHIRQLFGEAFFDEITQHNSTLADPKKILDFFWKNINDSTLKTLSINDSTINFRLNIDQLVKVFNLTANQLTIDISDPKHNSEIRTIGYEKLRNEGVHLKKHTQAQIFISFNLNLEKFGDVCYCESLDKHYTITLPLKVQ